jgi:ribosomal subunit interface protein
MRIQVHGKQIETGDALRSRVEFRLRDIAGKYAERATAASATFGREGGAFRVDAKIHLPTGMIAQAQATAPDAHAAFDACAERIEKRLRRYKRRLKDHHGRRTEPIAASLATAYVLRGDSEGDATGLAEAAGPADPAALDPVIVAETRTEIPTLTVGEAVMQMELAHAPALMFRNERHGGLNVVYRRDDAAVGWIDPDSLIDSTG